MLKLVYKSSAVQQILSPSLDDTLKKPTYAVTRQTQGYNTTANAPCLSKVIHEKSHKK